MTRWARKYLFNIFAGLSLALFIATAVISWRRYSAYVPMDERIYREREKLEATQWIMFSLTRDVMPLMYLWEHGDRILWERNLDAIAENYQIDSERILAADRQTFVVQPLELLCLFALLPMLWLAIAWRRLEIACADRRDKNQSIWARAYLSVTMFVAIIAFVLGALLGALIIRSFRTADILHQSIDYVRWGGGGHRQVNIQSGRGSIGVYVDWQLFSGAPMAQVQQRVAANRWLPQYHSDWPHDFRQPGRVVHYLLGATWSETDSNRNLLLYTYSRRPLYQDVGVEAPLWPIAAVLIGGSVGLWTHRRAIRRRPPGHCRGCGYDLHGNASGVCPECGKKVIGSTETSNPSAASNFKEMWTSHLQLPFTA